MKRDLILAIVAVIICTVVYDVHFFTVIGERGGFAAWMQTNCMWCHAVALSVVFHLVAVVAIWACVISMKDVK